jgi:SGNH domain (fused to AT3 domains)
MRRVMVRQAGVMMVGLMIVALGITGNAGASSKPHGSVPLISQYPTLSQVTAQIMTAERTATAPASVRPSLSTLADGGDFGMQNAGSCAAPGTNTASVNVKSCTFGDKSAKETVVLTGDSRAQMWLDAFETVATGAHFKLILLAKEGCPAPLATYRINNDGSFSNSPWTACTKWHSFVIKTIDALKPQAVVVSSEESLALADPVTYALPAAAEQDMLAFLKTIPAQSKAVVLGDFPEPGATDSPTLCLSKGPKSLLSCGFTPSQDVDLGNGAAQSAATADNAAFINQTPWLCAATCPAVIDGIIPYTIDGYHIDNTYTLHLIGVLWAVLEPYIADKAAA